MSMRRRNSRRYVTREASASSDKPSFGGAMVRVAASCWASLVADTSQARLERMMNLRWLADSVTTVSLVCTRIPLGEGRSCWGHGWMDGSVPGPLVVFRTQIALGEKGQGEAHGFRSILVARLACGFLCIHHSQSRCKLESRYPSTHVSVLSFCRRL